MSGYGVMLLCDPCKNRLHDSCAGTVRAFIDQDGPDWYVCECSCARRKRERDTAERKVREVCDAFVRRYSADDLATVLAPYRGTTERENATVASTAEPLCNDGSMRVSPESPE